MPATFHQHTHPVKATISILGWPSWLRILVVAPMVALLWLAVLWANMEQAPW